MIVKTDIMRAKQTILQDMCIPHKPEFLQSSVTIAECYVCGMGINDGCAVTAKTLRSGIVMFCDTHYPSD